MRKEEIIEGATEVSCLNVAESNLKPGDKIIIVGTHATYVFDIYNGEPKSPNGLLANCTRLLGGLELEGWTYVPLDAVWKKGDLIHTLFQTIVEQIYLKISNCDPQIAKEENAISPEDSATLLSPSELPLCWPEGHGACKVLIGGNGHFYLCDSSRNDEMVFHVYCWDNDEFAQMEEIIKNYP